MSTTRIPQQQQQQQQRKHKYSQGQEFENGVFEKLDMLLGSVKEQSNSGASDLQQLSIFLQRGFATQAVQSWSYYAQVNNHARFAHTTRSLVELLTLMSTNEHVLEQGSTLIKLFLSDYVKVFYRGLNSMRTSITLPILHLMQAIVYFNNGQHVEDFINHFDLSLPSLSKLLTPSKVDISKDLHNKNSHIYLRYGFLEFWITFLHACPSFLRKSILIENHKIMSAWFKNMDKLDGPELMTKAIDFLITDILEEKTFRKMTKTKIINELCLAKLHSFYSSTNAQLVKHINQFFLKYAVEKNTSVSFPTESLWFTEPPFSSVTSQGASIIVNQIEFKIHNKLLFNMLKNFKPWEDELQSATVLKVLKNVPELIPPYCSLLASQSTNEPRMSSYWFGYTLLLGRVINLEIPQFIEQIDTNIAPTTSLVIENIIPSPISKPALTKGIQSEQTILIQLTCQLLIFSFKKLLTILELYDRKGWTSAKVTLTNAFHTKLPELSILVNAINHLSDSAKPNKLCILSLSTILKHYSMVYPNYFSISLPSSNIYLQTMQNGASSGIDFANLDQFLQFQEFNTTQTKWWNSSPEQNSLFTSLLKLGSSNNSSTIVSNRIIALLDGFLGGIMAFNKLDASPIAALLNSLQTIQISDEPLDLSKVWKLLDETISRAVKTPYKYVDASGPYGHISPFLLALAEQWSFITKESCPDVLVQWIHIFLRNMIIIGEKEEHVLSLASKLDCDSKSTLLLTFENYEEVIPRLQEADNYFLQKMSTYSFFNLVMLSNLQQLQHIERHPTNIFDACACLFRAQVILKDESVKFSSNSAAAIKTLLFKASSYGKADPAFDIFMRVRYTEGPVKEGHSLRKDITYFHELAILFKDIRTNAEEFHHILLQHFKDITKRDKDTQIFAASFLATCLECFDSTEIIDLSDHELIPSEPNLLETALHLLVKSKHKIPFKLLLQAANCSSPSIVTLLAHEIIEKNVSDPDVNKLVMVVKENPNLYELLNSLIKAKSLPESKAVDLVKDGKGTFVLSLQVALAVTDTSEASQKFLKSVVLTAYSQLKGLSDDTMQKVLLLFYLHGELLDEEKHAEVLKFVTTECSLKYSPITIKYISSFKDFSEQHISRWLNKMVLYITKYLSERQKASKKFSELISEFQIIISKCNIWKVVKESFLNAQLQAIVESEWVAEERILQFAILVSLEGAKSKLDSTRLAQLLLNNENNNLNKHSTNKRLLYLTTLLYYIFFQMDKKKNSNIAVQEKLVTFYGGTSLPHDRLLFTLLEMIESELAISWTSRICDWSFVDELEEENADLFTGTPLVTSVKEGLVVSLRKKLLRKAIDHCPPELPPLPDISNNQSALLFKSFMEFYAKSSLLDTYDPTFVMLLIMHNEELVVVGGENHSHCKVDVQKLLGSSLLQLIICFLGADGTTSQVARLLLTQVLYSLETDGKFRDSTILKILIRRIMFALTNKNDNGQIAPILWYSIARICDLLADPTCHLYEHAFRWVLNGHTIRPNELPLLYDITISTSERSMLSNYYTQLSWVLQTMTNGIRTPADIAMLRQRGTLEWLANLANSAYINYNISNMIERIFYNIQRIDSGSSYLLMRIGTIAGTELHMLANRHKLMETEKSLQHNPKNRSSINEKTRLQKSFNNEASMLLGFNYILKNQKRLQEWTNEDDTNIAKRIHI